MAKQGDREWVYCSTCRRETQHELGAVFSRRRTDEYNVEGHRGIAFDEAWQYRLWYCLGCHSGVFEEACTHAGMEDENGVQLWDSTFYPKRDRGRSMLRFHRLEPKLARMYREVIECYNAGLDIVCTVGMRALLEGVCAEKGITGRNLEAKIDGLAEYLPANIVEGLHGFRFMGNQAAHELEASHVGELRLAIDVIEDVLNFLYELEYKARGVLKSSQSSTVLTSVKTTSHWSSTWPQREE